jgi:hypothetical protein
VRTRFGSAFIVQATFSRIMPGTSQSMVPSSTWFSSASGTFAVTPSSAWPGSKRYASGRVASPTCSWRGKRSSVTDSAPWRIRIDAIEEEQLGPVLRRGDSQRGAVPRVERAGVAHFRREVLRVELHDRHVVHEHVRAARAVLQLLDLADQLPVVRPEGVRALELAGHQRALDEDFARSDRIELAEAHLAPRREHQAEERHVLVGHHFAARLVPVGLDPGALHQVRAAFSIQSGSTRATLRAKTRVVSCNSPATIQRGRFFFSPEPGQM